VPAAAGQFTEPDCAQEFVPLVCWCRGYIVDVSLKGTSVEPDADDMAAAYGEGTTPADVLQVCKQTAVVESSNQICTAAEFVCLFCSAVQCLQYNSET
jgi:hypothetical protein